MCERPLLSASWRGRGGFGSPPLRRFGKEPQPALCSGSCTNLSSACVVSLVPNVRNRCRRCMRNSPVNAITIASETHSINLSCAYSCSNRHVRSGDQHRFLERPSPPIHVRKGWGTRMGPNDTKELSTTRPLLPSGVAEQAT